MRIKLSHKYASINNVVKIKDCATNVFTKKYTIINNQ